MLLAHPAGQKSIGFVAEYGNEKTYFKEEVGYTGEFNNSHSLSLGTACRIAKVEKNLLAFSLKYRNVQLNHDA